MLDTQNRRNPSALDTNNELNFAWPSHSIPEELSRLMNTFAADFTAIGKLVANEFSVTYKSDVPFDLNTLNLSGLTHHFEAGRLFERQLISKNAKPKLLLAVPLDRKYWFLIVYKPRLFNKNPIALKELRGIRKLLSDESYLSLHKLHDDLLEQKNAVEAQYQFARLSIDSMLSDQDHTHPYQITLDFLLRFFHSQVGSLWEYHDNRKLNDPSYLTLEGTTAQHWARYKKQCLKEGDGLCWQVLHNPSTNFLIKKNITQDELANKDLYPEYRDKSVLMLRLEVDNIIYGVVCLVGGSFDGYHLHPALDMFQKIAALEIHKKKLETENRLLEAIAHIVPKLGGTPEASAKQITQSLRELINAQAASIFLKPNLDPGADVLQLLGADIHPNCAPSDKLASFLNNQNPVEYKVDDKSLTGIISISKQSVLCNDIFKHPSVSNHFFETKEPNNETWIGVPIKNQKGESIGVIRCAGKLRRVDSGERNFIFNSSDLFVLEYFAGIVSATFETIKSITELNKLNQNLKAAERIRAHEVRAPLGSITANASFVLKYLDESGARSKAKRLQEIVGDAELCSFLLREVRIPPTQEFRKTLRYVAPKDLLSNVEKYLKRQVQQRSDLKIIVTETLLEAEYEIHPFMSLELSGSSGKTMLSRSLMQRAVFNLGVNAVKYGVPNGSLKMSLSEDREGDNIIIDFVDDGIGINTEEVPYIFNEGYRASNVRDLYTGDGLGLYIAKAIVEAHKGRIDLISNKDPTHFRITLPIEKFSRVDYREFSHPNIIRMDKRSVKKRGEP